MHPMQTLSTEKKLHKTSEGLVELFDHIRKYKFSVPENRFLIGDKT
jgi:hypothetical protein